MSLKHTPPLPDRRETFVSLRLLFFLFSFPPMFSLHIKRYTCLFSASHSNKLYIRTYFPPPTYFKSWQNTNDIFQITKAYSTYGVRIHSCMHIRTCICKQKVCSVWATTRNVNISMKRLSALLILIADVLCHGTMQLHESALIHLLPSWKPHNISRGLHFVSFLIFLKELASNFAAFYKRRRFGLWAVNV